MDIQAIDTLDTALSIDKLMAEETQPVQPTQPAASSVNAFEQALKNDTSAAVSGVNNTQGENGLADNDNNAGINDPQLQDLLLQLIQLVQAMLAQVNNDSDNTTGGSTSGPGGGVNPVEGNGPGGSADNSGGLIPKPTEHIQELNLGGKTVTVGGDGSASADEVAATAQSIEHLYQNSPTFKNMIDTSSDPAFEVSVGRRDDNTSWGNSGGRVFMNINNIDPGNSDTFQGLLGHEFAHASIDIGHGAQIEQIEDAVAREA